MKQDSHHVHVSDSSHRCGWATHRPNVLSQRVRPWKFDRLRTVGCMVYIYIFFSMGVWVWFKACKMRLYPNLDRYHRFWLIPIDISKGAINVRNQHQQRRLGAHPFRLVRTAVGCTWRRNPRSHGSWVRWEHQQYMDINRIFSSKSCWISGGYLNWLGSCDLVNIRCGSAKEWSTPHLRPKTSKL